MMECDKNSVPENVQVFFVLKCLFTEFYVLLTVHLDAILGNDQFPLDRHGRQSLTRMCYTR
jgi:hypothetical protein